MIKQLSESEYKLLKLLAAYPNQTIHRQQIEIELVTIQKEGYKLIINQ